MKLPEEFNACSVQNEKGVQHLNSLPAQMGSQVFLGHSNLLPGQDLRLLPYRLLQEGQELSEIGCRPGSCPEAPKTKIGRTLVTELW